MNRLIIKIWTIIALLIIPVTAMSQRITITPAVPETESNRSKKQAQKKKSYLTVDTAKYILTYTCAIIKDTSNHEKVTKGYVVTLVGNRTAKFVDKVYVDGAKLEKQLKKQNIPSNEISQKVLNVRTSKVFLEHILLDYPEKGAITFQAYLAGSFRRYRDDEALQAWKIENETKEILGYQCRKATCHFRGRDYEAWYAEDLPIPYGPYYFRGLPGAIIELYDTDREYAFNMVGFERPDEITDISILNGKSIENISRDDFRFLKAYYNDNAAATLTTGPIKLKLTPEEEKELEKRLNRPTPYNPIEKE